ncbi:His Kinase A (phospho-acceptor) domain-containing protein [Microbacterium sp. cf046]|uniref:sensor histidine kinase n=1 Tax=Microbacterium sp. cf046 TaxID=1761803 RepID=UPI0008ED2C51|nr:HAMP domain-containing sensor histidine kinase [Microbacterium sp. cf046]SFS03634.1 His Kinase A (phospho-acceptor) domain-containing protein [Microbacterium sp. cf046]
MSDADDRRRVQRAAVSIGLYVGIASAIVIASGVGILITVILLNRRPESAEHGGGFPGGHGTGDDFVIDADRVLPLVIVLGLIGVVLLGLVAWFAARRSVRPLGDALRLQRNFVADASHELRTPLTALTSRIQVLQRRHDRRESIDDTIVALRQDAAMMTDVLNDLLLAAEGGAATAGEHARVASAVGTAVESLRPLADDAGVSLGVEIRTDALVSLPEVTLVRLVIALVDNALQHSPRGGAVTVSVTREVAHAAIRVTDQGSGIRGIEPDAVFERFARSSESGRRRGFGLGLSLVRDVAVRAGGSVAVERTSDAGTTFLLRLPISR